MYKKIKIFLYIISFFIFIFLTTYFYFSEENIRLINKSRTAYLSVSNDEMKNLQLLENDTKNIIEYRPDIEVYKKKKKNYSFWDLIKSK